MGDDERRLARGPRSAVPTLVETEVAAPPARPEGSDRYVVDREIARGGMARIYAARDLKLSRDVAVKVLASSDPRLAERFAREVRLVARLSHPGIIHVHDSGQFATGEPFLVMNLVHGRPFHRVIADAETMDDRLALLPHITSAADALAYAHDRGVIHRDLKPSNILVGAFGETVVIDWGLAKDLGSGEPEPEPPARALTPATGSDAPVSTPGGILGTPAYMPPEQAAGQPLDARADVYALGAVLYHAVSGTPPHAGSRTSEVLEKARALRPTALGALEPSLPADLVAIVEKAMAFEKDRRYPSAFELAEDLKRFQAGQRVAARRYSAMDLARRWTGQYRVPLLVAAALAAAVALGRC